MCSERRVGELGNEVVQLVTRLALKTAVRIGHTGFGYRGFHKCRVAVEEGQRGGGGAMGEDTIEDLAFVAHQAQGAQGAGVGRPGDWYCCC